MIEIGHWINGLSNELETCSVVLRSVVLSVFVVFSNERDFYRKVFRVYHEGDCSITELRSMTRCASTFPPTPYIRKWIYR